MSQGSSKKDGSLLHRVQCFLKRGAGVVSKTSARPRLQDHKLHTCRGLLVDERGGYLRRVRGEDTQRGSSDAHETRGETAAAVGGEHTESKHNASPTTTHPEGYAALE
jgi:hypothetical protein